jgi:hypothetical protein
MNTRDTTTHTHGLQAHHLGYCPPGEDPLRGAMIANAQLKLCLRRLRAGAAGSHRTAAITRLLDVGESVDRSLSWLRGSPDDRCRASAVDDELAELGQLAPLAMDAAATPEAVGVSQ